MIPENLIRAELPRTLETTRLPLPGQRHEGKVRDSYTQGNRRILVTTDRVSAFDCVLGTIPFKGQVLNQIAAFWFEKTRDLAPNHVLDIPDPNVMVVKECEQLPLEFIVRGYITGVTKTSAWYNYERGVRNLCGNPLPEGLKKDQILARPILTPTTKHEEHDRNISREEAIKEGLIDGALFDKAADLCFKLFKRGQEFAATRGLILVDTKYEIGMRDGQLTVSDEIHTPDSSRYWFADTYAALFAAGQDQRKLDKEYVREWLAAQGFRGDGKPPALTDEVRIEAARRYIQAYEVVTGLEFTVTGEPVADRMLRNLKAKGYLE
ncbi:MAG: phosphoribosylaminoimidazolesuccinocarboxamide synthase [Kiritimatiellia bacterium]